VNCRPWEYEQASRLLGETALQPFTVRDADAEMEGRNVRRA